MQRLFAISKEWSKKIVHADPGSRAGSLYLQQERQRMKKAFLDDGIVQHEWQRKPEANKRKPMQLIFKLQNPSKLVKTQKNCFVRCFKILAQAFHLISPGPIPVLSFVIFHQIFCFVTSVAYYPYSFLVLVKPKMRGYMHSDTEAFRRLSLKLMFSARVIFQWKTIIVSKTASWS